MKLILSTLLAILIIAAALILFGWLITAVFGERHDQTFNVTMNKKEFEQWKQEN
jgi:hypothetical protein